MLDSIILMLSGYFLGTAIKRLYERYLVKKPTIITINPPASGPQQPSNGLDTDRLIEIAKTRILGDHTKLFDDTADLTFRRVGFIFQIYFAPGTDPNAIVVFFGGLSYYLKKTFDSCTKLTTDAENNCKDPT